MLGIRDTSSETLRKLLGNGLTYEIPKFQRDYSWELEQWDDLWQDLHAVFEIRGESHYMGYLVLQTTNSKEYLVIDGQQRFTTLSILILAVLKSLRDMVEQGDDPENNQRRLDSIRSSYIGSLDTVTLITTNKLRLNRNNDDFYRHYLSPIQEMPARGLNSSEKLMKSCFNWLYDKVRSKYTTGEELARFVDQTVDRLFFTVITVSDSINAFKVFETLNARGVKLSSADLLKNYLFSLVDSDGSHKSEIEELETLWSKVIGKLGNEKIPEFLRMYWNSKNRTVRKNELFKAIRREVNSKQAAFALIRELEKKSDLYIALRSPNDEMWATNELIRKHLKELKLFQVRQPISLLIAAYDALDIDGFEKVLKATTIISFRYNIIGGLNPNEQEKVYNDTALQIRESNEFSNTMLREVYPNDESFEVEFTNKTFNRTPKNHKLVKYILSRVEKQRYQVEIDPFDSNYTVEHVLPENPGENWEEIDDDVLDRCVYRLGNLTLLEPRLNRDAENLNFAQKRPLYRQSSLNITHALAERYETWDEEKINQRQAAISGLAKAIWQLQFN